MWNPASILDMMSDDLDITEAVVLDHITAILYVGRWSVGEGLTEEEAQACIEHFSPYIGWRDVAVKREFQALTLAEAQEEIQAYEAQNHRSIQGRGQPSSTRFIKAPIGLDYSPNKFQERRGRNRRFNPHNDDGDYAPRGMALDRNTLPPVDNFLEGRDGMSHGDKAPTSPGTIQRTVNWTLFLYPLCQHPRPVPTRDNEQDGTFDHCLNRKSPS